MEQQGGPPTMHIKPRGPIINQDYATAPIDLEAALFVIQSYEDARVVDIDGIILTAGQLRRNVSEEFITDEVILFQIHVVSVNMCTPTMY